QQLDHPLEAFAVQLPANLAIEPLAAPVHREEPEELSQPGERLAGVSHESEVQPEAVILGRILPTGAVEVEDDERRIVADQGGVEFEDLDRHLARQDIKAVESLVFVNERKLCVHHLRDRAVPSRVDQEDVETLPLRAWRSGLRTGAKI